ncbi:MAG TPA: hypothetical protein VK548_12030, partial [Candidatus Acidoferrum sp.]|nr:hypothetical protein [Candidatus Acidoferrum sp.]
SVFDGDVNERPAVGQHALPQQQIDHRPDALAAPCTVTLCQSPDPDAIGWARANDPSPATGEAGARAA